MADTTASTPASQPLGPPAEPIAERLRIFGQPIRIRLIDALRGGPAAVHELTTAVDGVQQNVSQHLTILRQAGIVSRHKHGTRVLYQLADPHALAVLDCARAGLDHHLETLSSRLRQAPEPSPSGSRGRMQ